MQGGSVLGCQRPQDQSFGFEFRLRSHASVYAPPKAVVQSFGTLAHGGIIRAPTPRNPSRRPIALARLRARPRRNPSPRLSRLPNAYGVLLGEAVHGGELHVFRAVLGQD